MFERIQNYTRWAIAEAFIGLAKKASYVILEANTTVYDLKVLKLDFIGFRVFVKSLILSVLSI